MTAARACAAARTERIVGRLLETLPRRGGRGNLLREEIRGVVVGCLDLVEDADRADRTARADEPRLPDPRRHVARPADAARMDRIHRAAARWAGVGVPIDTVHRLVREGFRLHLDDALRPDGDEVARLLDALHAVTVTVSTAYSEVAPARGEAVARALLGGDRRARRVASEHGAPLAERYLVLAVHTRAASAIPGLPRAPRQHQHGDREHRERRDPPVGGITPEVTASGRDGGQVGSGAHPTASAFREALARHCGQSVPALLSRFGGTVLVPSGTVPDGEIAELATAGGLTVAVTEAAAERIPEAADFAHELLDLALRMHGGPGLHHFDDLALEYQLTRPGPARDHLAGVLDPLVDHPDLLETLRVHLRNGLNRRRTARALHIHQNTVDHRIRRIGALLGLDASRPSTLWRLRAALVARSYTHPDTLVAPTDSGDELARVPLCSAPIHAVDSAHYRDR
ncbi:PucR family transcriptional regulator [Nocardia takedensis]|uniref:PucR family transcriptional regulator n=1 Tax=Nocardia takedensis TaxID=259390 RepID=UPI0003131CCB|nr:helix-turn-helix domain-containing protein [Nocardia takedensis]